MDTKNNEGGPSVLITGGSGLVGRQLSSLLLSQGFDVSVLSRNTHSEGKARVYGWNPEKEIINPEIFKGVDYVVHLSGASIGEKRWTKKRKKAIVSSRISSARLLHKIITENHIDIKAFISASAIGYYGTVTSEKIFSEEDPPSEDFLGTTCRLWEEEADRFEHSGIRTVKIRTAVILWKNDIALGRLMRPARFGIVVRLGSGRQYFPWIHMDDLCNIYLKALRDDSMRGVYNAVAPEHINHDNFVRTMARVMRKPVFLPRDSADNIAGCIGRDV